MKLRDATGTTLIELIIALVLSSILISGIYGLLISQQRAYSAQDRVVAIQQDARAALTIMTKDIRMAGFLVGSGGGAGFSDGTTNVTVNGFTEAVTPVNSTSGPDSVTVVYAATELGTVQSVAAGTVTLSNDIDGYFTNGGSLVAEKCFVSFDVRPDNIYRVSAVSGTNISVVNLPVSNIAAGTTVYGVKAVTYSVASGMLRRNENTGEGAQPLVGDGTSTVVEDVQFAYQLSGDTSWYNGGGFPAGAGATDIRMVRINLVMRTGVEDADDTNYRRPALEDRGASTMTDGYRRRVYTTSVNIRNMGG